MLLRTHEAVLKDEKLFAVFLIVLAVYSLPATIPVRLISTERS